MKIFKPEIHWVGDFHNYISLAFRKNQVEVVQNHEQFSLNKTLHLFRLHHIDKVGAYEFRNALRRFNDGVLKDVIEQKPDVFLTFNESRLYPDTIRAIREQCKCLMVCILGDDPWDSSRWVADFPHSLKYFHFIFNPEVTWNVNIRKVAPEALIYHHNAGFDPEYFFPQQLKDFTPEEVKKFSCELSFTGTSYGPKAEGAYRSDILSFVADFDLKIFGDNNWPYRFRYLPELSNKFYGTRLPIADLRKLYTLSKINLNLPAPQLPTCFQPRVYEIAATKGFQIIDNRSLLQKMFSPDEIVTFDTIPELREKVRYYLDHENERKVMIDKLYKTVTEKYTWQQWARRILSIIEHPDDHPLLKDELYPHV